MPVVLIITALIIVAAIVRVAAGRGGELSVERTDYAALEMGPVSATDVVSPKLADRLARDLAALAPFVRWLNRALGLRTLGNRLAPDPR